MIKKTFITNLFTILLITIGLIFFIELSGQIYYYIIHGNYYWREHDIGYNQKFTPYGLLEYLPDSTINMPGYPDKLKTDMYGFISNGYNKPISPSDFLIFILGGSTVEGRGASTNRMTIAAILERELNNNIRLTNYNKFRVINAGISGHVSYQELSVLDGKILQNFNPKIIIVLDGRNDADCVITCKNWKINWQPYYDQLSLDINNYRNHPFLVGVKSLFASYSCIFGGLLKFRIISKNFVISNIGVQKTPNIEPPSEKTLEKAADSYLINHIVGRKRSELNSIKYFVFLQPILIPIFKKSMTNSELGFIKDWDTKDAGLNYFSNLAIFYRLIVNNAKKTPWFYNISDIFHNNTEQIYTDSCHYNDLGNKIIADAIFRVINPYINSSGIMNNQAGEVTHSPGLDRAP